MKHVNLLIFIFLLVGCKSTAENNAISWMRKVDGTSPIYSVQCEDEEDENGMVTCTIATEDIGRLFVHQLKCYNSNRHLGKSIPKCHEALDV